MVQNFWEIYFIWWNIPVGILSTPQIESYEGQTSSCHEILPQNYENYGKVLSGERIHHHWLSPTQSGVNEMCPHLGVHTPTYKKNNILQYLEDIRDSLQISLWVVEWEDEIKGKWLRDKCSNWRHHFYLLLSLIVDNAGGFRYDPCFRCDSRSKGSCSARNRWP